MGEAMQLGFSGALTAAIQTHDLDAALKWYDEHLGFKLIYRIDEMGWAEVSTSVPGVNLGISQVEDVKRGGGATLTFGVKDIGNARTKLEKAGVRFDGETADVAGMVKLATFYDRDDNALMLFELYGTPPAK
jgi:catechol 2,3-dioxygenase-like lactoylglutathione lyase family enzyme